MSMKVIRSDLLNIAKKQNLAQLARYKYPKSVNKDNLVQKTYQSIIHSSWKLRLSDVQFSANSFEQFCVAVENANRHTTLDMDRVSVDTLRQGEMVKRVIEAIANHIDISHLNITNSQISDSDVPYIIEGIAPERFLFLSSISFADNEICGEQAYNLANTINEKNFTLDLSRNLIDENGVMRIQQLGNSRIILDGNLDAIYSNNHDLKRAV